MSERRVWIVEEVPIENDQVGQRQTVGTINLNDETGEWHWNKPDLNEKTQAEWDRIMTIMSNVDGEDLRHLVCYAGLMDHCVNKKLIDCYNEKI